MKIGKIVMEIFLVLWIVACLAAWFLINASVTTQDSVLLSKLPPPIAIAINKTEQWFGANPWIRQYIWRTSR